MLKAWMLEHTQRLHRALTLSPCESSGMHLYMLCLLLVLRAALTCGPQLRCFRCLFTLASGIPFKELAQCQAAHNGAFAFPMCVC